MTLIASKVGIWFIAVVIKAQKEVNVQQQAVAGTSEHIQH